MDILRAAAVLFVYFAHLRQFVVTLPFQLYQLGRFGVLIFFLHTCLVLLYSIERSTYAPGLTTLNFYVRRLFRIYPLSIVTVAIVIWGHIPAAPNLIYHTPSAKQLVSNLALVQNLTHDPEVLLTMWSLPWEIEMYVVLPLLFFGLARRSVWWGVALWLAVVIVRGFFRIEALTYVPHFLSGLIAFQMMHQRRRFSLPAWMWPVVLALVTGLYAIAWRSRPPIPLFGSNLCSLILGLSVPTCLEPMESRLTRASHLIARYSYGIYLSHTPIMWFAFVSLTWAPVAARVAVLTVLSVGVPVVLYHGLEAPLIRLGVALARMLCRRYAIPQPAVVKPDISQAAAG